MSKLPNNQNYLGVEIVFVHDYATAKRLAGDGFWSPISGSYSSCGKAVTQAKREIKRNLAGYYKGQRFFIYSGLLGLGNTESPHRLYYAVLADANNSSRLSPVDRYQGLKNGTVKPESLTEECIAAGTDWAPRPEAEKVEALWIWHWVGGGYNSARNCTRSQAIEQGNKMNAKLIVDEDTLHVGTYDELGRLDRSYD